MLGGRALEDIIEGARKHFLYVSANLLRKEDMAKNTPDSSLGKHAKRGRLGDVDAFVSHSRHDDSDAKWEFKKDQNGKEPTLWIDKYCIDQNNIEESLACLPVFLFGTSKLLIICGNTYLERLWCLVEIMVFIEMGGNKENLEIRLLDGAVDPISQKTDLRSSIHAFDPRKARCTPLFVTYSLRLIKISHVNLWVQAANCEIGETTTQHPLRIHRNKDLDAEISVKSDLEPFQPHTMNILYEI